MKDRQDARIQKASSPGIFPPDASSMDTLLDSAPGEMVDQLPAYLVCERFGYRLLLIFY